MSDTTQFILTDGAGLDAHADTADIIVVRFSRREVEAGRVGDAVDRLMSLSDTARRVRRFEGAVMIEFADYDFDDREIPAIPECRDFFRAISENWSHWFHYLGKTNSKALEQISLAIALLVPVTAMPSSGATQRFMLDPHDIARVVRRLFVAMNALHQQHGFSESESQRISDEIVAVLDSAYT